MLGLEGQHVLVLGAGVSGRSAAEFCARAGARVVLADESSAEGARREAKANGGTTAAFPPGVELRLGQPFPDPAGFDLVVPSPGVPPARYRARARRVWGDIELAGRALAVPIAAVTGTNGKSTTVRLLEAMLRAAGLRARAGGNVGDAALGLVGEPLDVAVLEVSSFQLETIERFRPRVAVLLNLTPDHLDRHGDLAGYLAAKARIFENQAGEDVAIVNADPALDALAAGLATRVWRFAARGAVPEGACWDGEAVCLRLGGAAQRLPLEGLPRPSGPLRENLLAALLAVAALGAEPAKALAALAAFRPLPHRTEWIAERAGVTWVNDSKATNPGATAPALALEARPIVWIAGGKDKGLDYAELAGARLSGVRRALLIGEAAPRIAAVLGDRVPHETVGTLDAAVARAAELARPGDVVLLSPACASFDQFRNFEHRGERFRELVLALPKGGPR
jgi:UDP-N-acetylmuramoylalanine--D-glutamate ligase